MLRNTRQNTILLNTIKTIFIFLILVILLNACQTDSAIKPGYFFGHDVRNEQRIIYVLDLSGSMNAASGNQLEQKGIDAAAELGGQFMKNIFGNTVGDTVEDRISKLKKRVEKVKLHLMASLNGLPDTAQFNIILFDGGVQKLSPIYLSATGFNTTVVSVFVDRLSASGSTNILEAMSAALNEAPNKVILLTDGMPTSSTPEQVISRVSQYRKKQSFTVSTVGVGDDMGRSFLSKLATENGGSYIFYN